jgi:hypothetical protein
MDWIRIGEIGIGCIVGFAFAFAMLREPPAPRCARTKRYKLTTYLRAFLPPVVSEVTLRCFLSEGHDGPHCVTLNAGQPNEREDWFEDEKEP